MFFFHVVLGEFEIQYELGHILGSGSFGTVFQGTRKSDGKKVEMLVFMIYCCSVMTSTILVKPIINHVL